MYFLLRRFIVLISIIAGAWALGLIVFLILIPSPSKLPIELPHVDAVVILTGDYLRLEKGVEVFLKSGAQKLLISGVPKKIAKRSVLKRIKKLVKKDLNPDDLYLGHIADSTISNAIETKMFMDLHKFKSLTLVTSNYHMPRSYYLFKRTMPEVEMHFVPAGLNKFDLIKTKWKYLLTEYHKLVGTVALNIYNDASDLYFNIIVKTAAFISKHYYKTAQ